MCIRDRLKVWHESSRYYRVSESSTDLYDSFRNLYLAIEALLSDVVPPTTKPNGNLEGDSEWLERALRLVGQTVDLSLCAPQSPKAPVASRDVVFDRSADVRGVVM